MAKRGSKQPFPFKPTPVPLKGAQMDQTLPVSTEPVQPGTEAAASPGGNGQEKLELDDLRVLQLLYKELENQALKAQNLQLQIEAAKRAVDDARTALSNANAVVNKKYNMNVERDRIDINTGNITRG